MSDKKPAGTTSIRLTPTVRSNSNIPLPGPETAAPVPIPSSTISLPPPPPRSESDASLYQGLFQNLYDAALITDLRGKITDANARAMDFLSYDKNEFRNLRIMDILSGADDSLVNMVLQNLENERFTFIEGYCVRKDGSFFPTEIVVNKLHENRKELCFFIRDITRRKIVEEELRKSEAKNRALLHAIPDLMLRISKDGVLLDFKSGTDEESFIPSNECLGKKIEVLFPEVAKEFMHYVERALQSNDIQFFEYQLPSHDNRYYEARIAVSEEGEALAIVRDITKRKHAEQAEKERLEHDLEIAQEIQQHLLPPAFPNIEGIEVGAMNVAAMKVGGDYYDVIQVDKDHWGFAIADVSGKGVSGALLMSICRSALRTKAGDNLSPGQVMKEVNRLIHPDMREDMFISMIYGVLNIHTRKFTFCRAGHEPLIIHRQETGNDEILSPRGMALGIDNGGAFNTVLEEKEVSFQKGDVMVFYTDGITEALNEAGQEFGRSQLVETIRNCANQSAEDITKALDDKIHQFVGKHYQNDDLTLMVVKI